MDIQIHICPIRGLYPLLAGPDRPSGAAAVLCTTGEVQPEKLAGIHWLQVPFADVTDESRPDAFQPGQARQIRDFVAGLQGVRHLYFCCDSGESRSTALAAAFLRRLDRNEMEIWKNVRYHPNPLVYYRQSLALGLELTWKDAQELAQYNQLLFRRAIAGKR